MDRIVNTVSAGLDRSQQYEGRARRLTSEPSLAEFRALVAEPPQEPTAPPVVSGWAGLVTAGRTGGSDSGAAPAQPAAEPAPTLESVFGDNPWVASPAGLGPLGVYYYNPVYFATTETAEKVAQIMGGKVVQRNEFGGPASPFQQLQANNMVELPNGHVVNPGLVATFYMRGYSQSFIDHLMVIEATT